MDDQNQIEEEEKKLEESFEMRKTENSKDELLDIGKDRFSETVVSIRNVDTAIGEIETAREMKSEMDIGEQIKKLKQRQKEQKKEEKLEKKRLKKEMKEQKKKAQVQKKATNMMIEISKKRRLVKTIADDSSDEEKQELQV